VTYTPKVGDRLVCTDNDGNRVEGSVVVTHSGTTTSILFVEWTITLAHPDISGWQYAFDKFTHFWVVGVDTHRGEWYSEHYNRWITPTALLERGPLTELRPVTP
jgi:hypothetical protein